MTRRPGSRAVLTLVLLLLLVMGGVAPAPRRDLGSWGVVVLQSDDWGLEGWFPDLRAATELADLVDNLPPRLRPYRSSSLETGSEVDALAQLLSERRDADGLPAVLQANHVVAGPSLRRWPSLGDSLAWPVHPSGTGTGAYRRDDLERAVEGAIARAVWWPELHGLTHYDLEAYAQARESFDPVATRALREGMFAYEGWLRGSELAGGDPRRAQRVVAEAVRRFRERFGRRPVSVVAPDYKWGPADETAWAREGLLVVQAKREQIDPSRSPGSLLGRGLKVVGRWWDRHRDRFVYLDRPARLEPYGDLDPSTTQGAHEAAAAVRAAWARGEPGIVSVHRVQLSNLDPAVSAAGRAQLRSLLEELERGGAVRYLVDAEVAQILRRGWSRVERGPWVVIRNFSGRERLLPGPDGALRSFAPGTHVFERR